ncbi:MAG: hypothetical protein SFZ03_04990 [Candidatus Melainabacteria bacterium]|nr:hypothetical protein [Candidatus Melainabacteria bacterium]
MVVRPSGSDWFMSSANSTQPSTLASPRASFTHGHYAFEPAEAPEPAPGEESWFGLSEAPTSAAEDTAQANAPVFTFAATSGLMNPLQERNNQLQRQGQTLQWARSSISQAMSYPADLPQQRASTLSWVICELDSQMQQLDAGDATSVMQQSFRSELEHLKNHALSMLKISIGAEGISNEALGELVTTGRGEAASGYLYDAAQERITSARGVLTSLLRNNGGATAVNLDLAKWYLAEAQAMMQLGGSPSSDIAGLSQEIAQAERLADVMGQPFISQNEQEMLQRELLGRSAT